MRTYEMELRKSGPSCCLSMLLSRRWLHGFSLGLVRPWTFFIAQEITASYARCCWVLECDLLASADISVPPTLRACIPHGESLRLHWCPYHRPIELLSGDPTLAFPLSSSGFFSMIGVSFKNQTLIAS